MGKTQILSKAAIQEAVDAIPHWFHSIDLGQGVVTPGDKTSETLEEELAKLQLPDLSGKTILDIGAWDGYYSWTAERMSASRVVSLDHFVWSIDRTRAIEYVSDWRDSGDLDPPRLEETDAWKPEELPGKRGYDLSHRILNSKAECVVVDFMDMNVEALGGPFDVVLFFGVLYHVRHPLLALKKVAEVTKDLAIIETSAFELSLLSDRALWEYFERDELDGDLTNWWAPNERALVALCRSAGFKDVEVIQGISDVDNPPPAAKSSWSKIKRAGGNFLREFEILPPLSIEQQPHFTRYRAIVHARK